MFLQLIFIVFKPRFCCPNFFTLLCTTSHNTSINNGLYNVTIQKCKSKIFDSHTLKQHFLPPLKFPYHPFIFSMIKLIFLVINPIKILRCPHEDSNKDLIHIYTVLKSAYTSYLIYSGQTSLFYLSFLFIHKNAPSYHIAFIVNICTCILIYKTLASY